MSPPFRVFGHPRSGNHLLAALLHQALAPTLPGAKIPNSGTGHWRHRKGAAPYFVDGVQQGRSTIRCPYIAVLGDHGFPPKVVNRQHVYVLRDGRDVALSFWNWPKIRAHDFADLDTFLCNPIDWRGSPGARFDARPNYTLFDHWRDHVDEWVKKGALCVRYENMVRDPAAVVARVARKLKLPVVGPTTLPKPVGWNPSGGPPKIGTWREELSNTAKALFEQKVPADHVGRYVDP